MSSPTHDPALISLDNLKKHPLPDWSGRASARAKASLLIVAPRTSEPGEVLNIARAALRAGAGRVALAVPAALAPLLGVTLPEAHLLPLGERDPASVAQLIREAEGDYAAIVFAPSLDQGDEGQKLARLASNGLKTSVLAGASAVAPGGNFSEETPFSSELAARVYRISAHETQWHGAASPPEADANTPKLQAALTWTGAHQNDAFVVIDAATAGVFADGKATHLALETTGQFAPGADAVRSGIIGALLAQGLNAALAAQWGALIYAEGALAITKDLGEDGFLARDIIDRLPAVLRYLKRQATTLDKSGFGLRAVK